MSNSKWKFPILILVFFLPVAWYLFLQFFGENKFVVPSFGAFNSECNYKTEYIIHNIKLHLNEEVNEWERLRDNLSKRNVKLIDQTECSNSIESGFIYLIDRNNFIRGKYQLSTSECDRLLVELDILIRENVHEPK